VLRGKRIKKYKLTQQDALLKENLKSSDGSITAHLIRFIWTLSIKIIFKVKTTVFRNGFYFSLQMKKI
jgi:hypothetical protein